MTSLLANGPQTAASPVKKQQRPPSEYMAVHRLQSAQPEPVEIRERYARGRTVIAVPAEGYVFPWGLITESLSGILVVFDFHLEGLQAKFEAKGRSATEMQERLFALVEEATDLTRRDSVAWNPLATGECGWTLIPGTLGKAAAFTALCHINEEYAFREWLITDILLMIPSFVQRLGDELEQEA